MSKYRTINTDLNRQYRNDLNWNFGQISDDMASVGKEIDRVEKDLSDTIDNIVGGGFIESLETARDNANDAATNANSKAAYADGRGKYANTQGTYAKNQGDYAKLKGDYANEKAILADQAAANANAEASNLDGLKIAVTDATQSANTAASNAVDATANAVQATTDAQTATSAANTATEKANDAADLANEKAGLAQTRIDELNDLDVAINESIDNAETATQSANDAADNSTSKANLADEKAQLANTAALNADEKAQLADNAATLANEKAQLAQDATDAAAERIETMDGLIPQVEGLENRGTHDSEIQYVKNNIVRHNGSSYQALVDNIGVPVTDTNTWSLVAQRGVDGEGAVSSVNGVSPEEDGNVILSAEDIGAETPQGAQEKADRALSDAQKYADDLEPDLTGYATEAYVENKVNEIDLSPYAKNEDLQDFLERDGKAADSAKLDGKTLAEVRGGTTKEDVGLSNVENVKQASKKEFDDLSQEFVSHNTEMASEGNVHGLRGAVIALGSGSSNYKDGSIAIGINASTRGEKGVAIGYNAKDDRSSLGNRPATSIGYHSSASGDSSIAIGNNALSVSNNTVSLGENTEASSLNSIAIGSGAKSSNFRGGVLGITSHSWTVPGDFTVNGTKNFEMPHPHPDKKDTHVIRHAAIESPTEGDTLYRYEVEATNDNETVELQLPDYFKYLNKDVDVWVNGIKHFGRAYADVKGDVLKVTCELKGKYRCLVIGTRNDDHDSVQDWDIKGVEREIGESWTGEPYNFTDDYIVSDNDEIYEEVI